MPASSKGRTVSESKVEMTEVILPIHTNALGTIFGGQIVSWIDIAGAVAASRHAKSVCVTASIDALSFVNPAGLGDFITLHASVNYVGKTSMEIGVRVDCENPTTGDRKHVATAYLTFVALDEHRRPRPVPPVIPETENEKRRYREAQIRREGRLKLKAQIQAKGE